MKKETLEKQYDIFQKQEMSKRREKQRLLNPTLYKFIHTEVYPDVNLVIKDVQWYEPTESGRILEYLITFEEVVVNYGDEDYVLHGAGELKWVNYGDNPIPHVYGNFWAGDRLMGVRLNRYGEIYYDGCQDMVFVTDGISFDISPPFGKSPTEHIVQSPDGERRIADAPIVLPNFSPEEQQRMAIKDNKRIAWEDQRIREGKMRPRVQYKISSVKPHDFTDHKPREDEHCEACDESPCMCSDPERTSTIY